MYVEAAVQENRSPLILYGSGEMKADMKLYTIKLWHWAGILWTTI